MEVFYLKPLFNKHISPSKMSKITPKKTLKIIFIFCSFASLYFVPWILVKAWITPLPNTIQEQVDEGVKNGLGGMILYIDQKGKPPLFYAGGWDNKEEETQANPHQLFKIASIGKLYDAVAVAKLVSDQQLSLDKTVADYFPELIGRIEYADQITLRMLVQHRSGIPNFSDTPDFWAHPAETNEAALALILDKPALFKPNEDYYYCNTNYLLITMLIEKVTGKDKFDYIQKNILEPLQLQNTYRSLKEVDLEKVMCGYHVGYTPHLKMEEYGMLATAEDVGIFIRALNDGSVFKKGEKEIYTSIYKYEHSGWVPGYQSFAEYFEDIDMVVVQFNATTDKDLYLWNLAEITNSRIVKIIRQNLE